MSEQREYPYVCVDGRTTSIQVGQLRTDPGINEADRVMQVISEHTGLRWQTVKLSGYWRVWCRETGVSWGHELGTRTRDFHRAVANATGFTVVSTESLP